MERAADVQCQAIKLRDAAVRDLGEGVVAATIPHVAFAGLLLPDLVAMWASELKRSYDPPAPQRPQPVSPQPATAPRRANGQVNAGLGEVTAAPAVPPKPLRRKPRCDPPPTEADYKAVVFMRGGAELPDGSPAVAGDQVNLPAAQAHALVMRGLADYAKGSAA